VPLTIGIDARAAAEVPAGRGRYVRELLRHLAGLENDHRFLLYARSEWACPDLDERFGWRLVPAGEPLWQFRAARRASAECDVFLATNTYLMAGLLRVPSLAVVFDMVPFQRGLGAARGSLAERATLRVAVSRAAALLAISSATREELVARFPAAAAKTRVTLLAADESFGPEAGQRDDVPRRYGIERPYVLAAGTLEPRKNLPRLIEAFAGLPEELRRRFELCLAGAPGWSTDETFDSIARHGEFVRTLGYVPDEDLPALYATAELFCYPSLHEGFGLPVLEAMSCGTAVITSRLSSLPEVGGDAVRYVDPRVPDDIRSALRELLTDPAKREDLARRGTARAAGFSWRDTAARTLAEIERAAGPT
jgi:glycosyltransferase involved in cell wall biosynthesis